VEKLLVKAWSFWNHARGCKKSPFDCGHCQAGIKWFGELPLDTLAIILQEPKR
jgi:hypothetical protein